MNWLKNHSFSLAYQGVKNGDVLIEYERKCTFESKITQTPIELKVMSIFAEVLRLNDIYYDIRDSHTDDFLRHSRLMKCNK
jgi:hypothetical protein